MKLIRQLDEIDQSARGGAISIGNFDGVHRGHAKLMRRLQERAQELDGPAVAFTFDPHPVRLLRPEHAPPPLTWTNRKAQLLGQLGIDALIAYPTTQALLNLEPAEFIQQVVVDQLQARAMIEGPNFYFGRNRAGNTDTLAALCDQHGIVLEIVEPLEHNGAIVSSSRVRDLLKAGEVQAAAELLSRPYRLRGMVTHGARRGREIGFPTANLEAIDTLIPKPAVYAGRSDLAGAIARRRDQCGAESHVWRSGL